MHHENIKLVAAIYCCIQVDNRISVDSRIFCAFMHTDNHTLSVLFTYPQLEANKGEGEGKPASTSLDCFGLKAWKYRRSSILQLVASSLLFFLTSRTNQLSSSWATTSFWFRAGFLRFLDELQRCEGEYFLLVLVWYCLNQPKESPHPYTFDSIRQLTSRDSHNFTALPGLTVQQEAALVRFKSINQPFLSLG